MVILYHFVAVLVAAGFGLLMLVSIWSPGFHEHREIKFALSFAVLLGFFYLVNQLPRELGTKPEEYDDYRP